MCRLFAMAAEQRAPATFWLLDAPDSISEQSHRNPDGAGLGWYDDRGEPVVDKQPAAAYRDREFARAAHDVTSRTFVSHVRLASHGERTTANTHPFVMGGRLFAHNGALGDLDALEGHLGEDLSLVQGDTDSERWAALVTREILRADGDVTAGITAATTWIAEHVGIYSANFVLASATELWALRYPATNTLYVLERDPRDAAPLRHRSEMGTQITSEALGNARTVVVASEPLDDDSWSPLESGTLLHVGPDLACSRHRVVSGAPRHPLSKQDVS